MATSKTVIGLQARLQSTRLPGKVLLPFAGSTILETIIRSLAEVASADETWVLTGDENKNRELIDFCIDHDIRVISGAEDDVQSRYIELQARTQADYLIRVTADNPLVQSDMIDSVILLLQTDQFDYVSNCVVQEYPLGLNVEGFTSGGLVKVRRDATADEKEHVTLRFKLRQGEFAIKNIAADDKFKWPELRLTVDEPLDYDFLKNLYSLLNRRMFDLDYLIDYLIDNKHLIINSHIAQVTIL